MRILLIRHGDPDYEHDALTERGKVEAELLAGKLAEERIDYAYVSTMGRAMQTAAPTLAVKGMEAEYYDWLREFSDKHIMRPDQDTPAAVCWDWLPQDWTKHDEFYDMNQWTEQEIMAAVDMKSYAKMVEDGLDELLARHGYVRDGRTYRAERPNDDTIALFCHFGVGCVMIGHLLGISPMPLWHGFAAAPTSVTTIRTEERREGIASFRISCYGDTTHLYVGDVEPSFSARFCELYTNEDERHD